MELILRKRLTGELVHLNGARILCRSSRRLGFVAPYPGQWVFHVLAPSESSLVRYNRQPAPSRCSLEVGDLLDVNGMELIVHSMTIPAGERRAEAGNPPPCEIEASHGQRVRITGDRLIGYDASSGIRVAATHDPQAPPALLTFAAGRWYLHDLNGNSLVRNGQPSGPSLALADGDRIRMQNKELLFHIGQPRAVSAPRTTPMPALADPSPSRERELVYRQAKDLCRRLLPVLRDPGRNFQAEGVSSVGIRSWLRLLRRPRSAAETLERLELFLSASPRSRVWLIELCRFLYQQSYLALSLRIVRALCHLYPLEGEQMQTLAKLYYQQGHDLQLSAIERLNAFEAAEKCTGVARRLLPGDRALADLQRAVTVEQKVLRSKLAEMAYGDSPFKVKVNAMGGAR